MYRVSSLQLDPSCLRPELVTRLQQFTNRRSIALRWENPESGAFLVDGEAEPMLWFHQRGDTLYGFDQSGGTFTQAQMLSSDRADLKLVIRSQTQTELFVDLIMAEFNFCPLRSLFTAN